MSGLRKRAIPFVFLNVAVTADGKLSAANRVFVPFGSPDDVELLYELRTEADAVLVGSATADQPGVTLTVGGRKFEQMRKRKKRAAHHLRVIASGSASLRPDAHLFQDRSCPTIVLTTEKAPKSKRLALAQVADDVVCFGEDRLDFPAALSWLKEKHGVRRLLSEGGGGVNGALFENDLVDVVYMTICPLIFGGRASPTLADGLGIDRLSDATQLRMTSMKRVGHEIFLRYVVHRKRP